MWFTSNHFSHAINSDTTTCKLAERHPCRNIYIVMLSLFQTHPAPSLKHILCLLSHTPVPNLNKVGEKALSQVSCPKFHVADSLRKSWQYSTHLFLPTISQSLIWNLMSSWLCRAWPFKSNSKLWNPTCRPSLTYCQYCCSGFLQMGN